VDWYNRPGVYSVSDNDINTIDRDYAMMTLDDLRRLTIMAIAALALLLTIAVGLAHCDEATLKSQQALLSLYIKSKNKSLPTDIRTLISQEIVLQSDLAGVPYEIIAAIICVDSWFDPAAIGPCGEIGLMQIYTMECAGVKFDKDRLFYIDYNITAGICIFLDKLKRCNGNLVKAIERYNGSGPGAELYCNKVCRVILDIFRFRIENGRSKPKPADMVARY